MIQSPRYEKIHCRQTLYQLFSIREAGSVSVNGDIDLLIVLLRLWLQDVVCLRLFVLWGWIDLTAPSDTLMQTILICLSVFKRSYSSTKRQSWCQCCHCTCVTNWLLDWTSRSHSGHMTCCHSWSTNPRFGRYVYVLCALVILFGLSVQFAAGRWVVPTFSSTSTGRINMSSFLMKAVSY